MSGLGVVRGAMTVALLALVWATALGAAPTPVAPAAETTSAATDAVFFDFDGRAHRWTRPLPLADTRALFESVRARLAASPGDGMTRVELAERLLDEAVAVAALAPEQRAGADPRALKSAALEVLDAAPAQGEDKRVTPRRRFLAGLLSLELGAADAGRTHLTAVVAADVPEVALASARLGDLDRAKGDLWTAVAHYERARKGADPPAARYASWRLAQCRLQLGDAAGAKRLLQDVAAQLDSKALPAPTPAFRRAVADDLARTIARHP